MSALARASEVRAREIGSFAPDEAVVYFETSKVKLAGDIAAGIFIEIRAIPLFYLRQAEGLRLSHSEVPQPPCR
ncbi:MAG TPA: hypothetical protein VNM47_01735 [Terriglobia bacterium]|nr:hypothetical protein [Terriglobia bacterium]